MDFTDWIKPIVSGAQNGASYGAKIRLPHAFVMTFLFQKGSLESKLRRIVQVRFFPNTLLPRSRSRWLI